MDVTKGGGQAFSDGSSFGEDEGRRGPRRPLPAADPELPGRKRGGGGGSSLRMKVEMKGVIG